ncbi:DNA methylase [Embleya sp. NPDC008237]|uniref:DNA methylase n=1 Tax=Embleya sp. NPDC008237 TaxID=3363978 RepID=UPI0036EDF8BD
MIAGQLEVADGLKPRLLDLCCCAGGAARGYQMAGYHVTGVDIAPQPNYVGDVFVQADAIEYARAHAHEYDLIHASPPCQDACTLTKGTNRGRTYPRLIEPTREVLLASGRPAVIENVPGAALRRDLMLCGEMFGLAVIRHRYFEILGAVVPQPEHLPHRGRVAGYRHGTWHKGPYFAVYGDGGGKGSIAQWQDAMGIHWTSVRKEIAEAIPPVYTHWIARALRSTATVPDDRAPVDPLKAAGARPHHVADFPPQ